MGRMHVAWNLVGMVSPLVAVLGDVGTALLVAFGIILPGRLAPGTFIGSGADALNTQQVHGPQTYEPGFNLTMGWRFENGVTVEATYLDAPWTLRDGDH